VYVYAGVPNYETVSHMSSLLVSGIHTYFGLCIKQVHVYVGLSEYNSSILVLVSV
jgi:hypothetical protein